MSEARAPSPRASLPLPQAHQRGERVGVRGGNRRNIRLVQGPFSMKATKLSSTPSKFS
jgi:hypothetical protein